MYNNIYQFNDWATDQMETRGDRTLTIDFCRANLNCSDISDQRLFQWTLQTFDSDDNEWQAGQTTQSYDNITISVMAITEKYHYINFIPIQVDPETLKKQQGFAEFNKSGSNFDYIYLFTDKLRTSTLYSSDERVLKVTTAIVGIVLIFCLVILRLPLRPSESILIFRPKNITQNPLFFISTTLSISWMTNFWLQTSFYEFQINPFIFAPILALLVTIFASNLNYIFFYALAIFSMIDHIMYLSFMPFAGIFVALGGSIYLYSTFGGIELVTYQDDSRLKELVFTQSTYEQVENDNLE